MFEGSKKRRDKIKEKKQAILQTLQSTRSMEEMPRRVFLEGSE